MQITSLALLEEIGIFLQNDDFSRLEKLIKEIETKMPMFHEVFGKFKVRSFSQKLSDITDALYVPGIPFGVLGRKLEKDEEKERVLEKRLLFCLELKNIIATTTISKEEKEFLELVYQCLY